MHLASKTSRHRTRWSALHLLIGTPFFIFFGWLSDRIGRKGIIMAGCLLAALTYFPLFHQLTKCVNPALAEALKSAPIVISAQTVPIWRRSRLDLNTRGYSFAVKPPEGGAGLTVAIGATQLRAMTPRLSQRL